MLLNRWTHPDEPQPQLLKLMLINEGLTPEVETLSAHAVLKEHRHPFDEIRVILQGNLILDIGGNQLLLKAGDRIDIPANTKHSKTVHGGSACISLVARRLF